MKKLWSRCVLGVLVLFVAAPSPAVEDSALDKYWTDDAMRVPYRAIVTPGRENNELLPLVIFLHGDWQDGTDNESQLGGYGNGSMQLIDQAISAGVPFVYIAPETTDAYWPPARGIMAASSP